MADDKTTAGVNDIVSDVMAWQRRADAMLARAPELPVKADGQRVTLTQQRRGLFDVFRKKQPPFEVTDTTISTVLSRLRPEHRPRADIAEIRDSERFGERMQIMSPRGGVGRK